MSDYDRKLATLLQEHYGFTEPDLRPWLRNYRPLPLPTNCSNPERIEAYDLYCAAIDSLRLGRPTLLAYTWHPRMRGARRWLNALQALIGQKFPERVTLLTFQKHRAEWWALRTFHEQNPEVHIIQETSFLKLRNLFREIASEKLEALPDYPESRGGSDFIWYPGGLRALALRCWPQRQEKWDSLWRIAEAADDDLPLIAMEPLDPISETYLTQRLHGPGASI